MVFGILGKEEFSFVHGEGLVSYGLPEASVSAGLARLMARFRVQGLGFPRPECLRILHLYGSLVSVLFLQHS